MEVELIILYLWMDACANAAIFVILLSSGVELFAWKSRNLLLLIICFSVEDEVWPFVE